MELLVQFHLGWAFIHETSTRDVNFDFIHSSLNRWVGLRLARVPRRLLKNVKTKAFGYAYLVLYTTREELLQQPYAARIKVISPYNYIEECYMNTYIDVFLSQYQLMIILLFLKSHISEWLKSRLNGRHHVIIVLQSR